MGLHITSAYHWHIRHVLHITSITIFCIHCIYCIFSIFPIICMFCFKNDFLAGTKFQMTKIQMLNLDRLILTSLLLVYLLCCYVLLLCHHIMFQQGRWFQCSTRPNAIHYETSRKEAERTSYTMPFGQWQAVQHFCVHQMLLQGHCPHWPWAIIRLIMADLQKYFECVEVFLDDEGFAAFRLTDAPVLGSARRPRRSNISEYALYAWYVKYVMDYIFSIFLRWISKSIAPWVKSKCRLGVFVTFCIFRCMTHVLHMLGIWINVRSFPLIQINKIFLWSQWERTTVLCILLGTWHGIVMPSTYLSWSPEEAH